MSDRVTTQRVEGPARRILNDFLEVLDIRELGCHSALQQLERERLRLEGELAAIVHMRENLQASGAAHPPVANGEDGEDAGEEGTVSVPRLSSPAPAPSPARTLELVRPVPREREGRVSLGRMEEVLGSLTCWVTSSQFAGIVEVSPRRANEALRHLHESGRAARRLVPPIEQVGEEQYQYGPLALLPPRAAAAFVPPRGSRIRGASQS